MTVNHREVKAPYWVVYIKDGLQVAEQFPSAHGRDKFARRMELDGYKVIARPDEVEEW